jgi:hypothetical protein
MACPWVTYGEVTLQIWRVVANMMNKQARTADNGWSSSFWVGREDNNQIFMKCYTGPWNWADNEPGKEKWIPYFG